MGCFSFYPTKNLGADGDGGMIVTSDEGLARRLKMLRVHGIEKRYFHDLHGYNSRLDELQAAILRVKLKRLEGWNERRRRIAWRYAEALRDLPVELPVTAEGNAHVFHVFALLTGARDALQKTPGGLRSSHNHLLPATAASPESLRGAWIRTRRPSRGRVHRGTDPALADVSRIDR